MIDFQLHPRLQQDTLKLGSFELCQLLLMNDSLYPWFILVPQRSNVSEVYQLNAADRQKLEQESTLLAQKLAEIYNADKMNIAALGNIVPQLHIHHIVRYKTDKAWAAPVWGKFDAVPYSDDEIIRHKQLIRASFSELLVD